MTVRQAAAPTSDERLMATLAHSLGLLIALIIWAAHRDKSRFVRFQALQAVAYDLTVTVLLIAAASCMVLSIVGGALIVAASSTAATSSARQWAGLLGPTASVIPCIAGGLMLLLGLGSLAGRIVAAVRVYQGHNHLYPIIGKRLAKMLE
jgi:uncharacterized Tic20 family protein